MLLMGCPGPIASTEPLAKDVNRNLPPIKEKTRQALKEDRPFGEWVIYQAGLCEQYGCI